MFSENVGPIAQLNSNAVGAIPNVSTSASESNCTPISVAVRVIPRCGHPSCQREWRARSPSRPGQSSSPHARVRGKNRKPAYRRKHRPKPHRDIRRRKQGREHIQPLHQPAMRRSIVVLFSQTSVVYTLRGLKTRPKRKHESTQTDTNRSCRFVLFRGYMFHFVWNANS